MRTAAAAALVVLLTFPVVEQLMRWSAVRRYPAPGERVRVDGRWMHIRCAGVGAPTVILEAGLGVGGSLNWAPVHDSIAAFARVCSYDRAGLLGSDARRGARVASAATIAAELRALLVAAAVEPPYVLVGHSFGAHYARMYTALWPDDVAGLVFVDASHPDQDVRIEATLGTPPPRARGAAVMSALARTGVPRALGRLRPAAPQGAGRDIERTVRAYLPLSMAGYSAELAARAQTGREVAASGTLGARPLVVLEAGRPAEQFGAAAPWPRLKRELHAELAALSEHAEHRIVAGAGHSIQFDRPGAVVAAVRDVVAAVRPGAAGRAPAQDAARR